MGKQYAKSFTTKADMDSVYDTTQRYLMARGFKITSAQKPSLIIAERGSKAGSIFSFHIEKIFQTLAVNIQTIGDGVQVTCNYDIIGYGLMTTGDRVFLDSEIEMLISNVNAIRS